jgi:hypothetical protein
MKNLGFDPQQQFNRLYRERRLQARARKQPFPAYVDACRRLRRAVLLARRNGAVNPVDFWNFVFAFDPKTRKKSDT